MMTLDAFFLIALGLIAGIAWILDAPSRDRRDASADPFSPSGPVIR